MLATMIFLWPETAPFGKTTIWSFKSGGYYVCRSADSIACVAFVQGLLRTRSLLDPVAVKLGTQSIVDINGAWSVNFHFFLNKKYEISIWFSEP